MRTERCENCRWHHMPSFQCRRHAPIADPQVFTRGNRDAATVWPLTQAHDWCGDWFPVYTLGEQQ